MPEAISTPSTTTPRTVKPGGWLAAQGRLPLAFMMLALAWLVVATALLITHPSALARPHAHPHVVALTHAWVLGFFVTVACGAIYQLAPVALGTTLVSERYGWWHFGLHAVGVPGMVYSFWVWDLKALGHFAFFVALGVLLFSVNTWRTVRQSGRGGVVAWSLVLAAAWLLTTVLVGLLLAANRYWLFIPLDPIVLLRAHAHLGLVGFFVTLLQGVGFQLVPMFTLGEVRNWRLAGLGLALSQIGLVVLAPALTWQCGWFAVGGAAIITAGLTCSAVGLSRALATRKKRALDPGTQAFLRGGVGLCFAAVVGVALLIPGAPGGSAAGGFGAMPYALLALAGGLLPCIAGMMCKIVPFLTWMRAYGPRVGRSPTPAAGALTHARLEQWGLGLQFAAVAPLLIGTWRLSEAWLVIGVWMLAAGVALFTADMIGVLRHLRPGGVSVSAPARKSVSLP
ncbi:hypothetical protein K0B96_16555 [Horticoccus luteus]|uniref:Uncharacterized protein n=1 Tax=Horticoccus luteus TaxID=2862869 RepID=A0A8F9XLC6_9BACT|nr:hypothetical protein [Horticoccus luteus]QYM78894.1 hypothetical protein K0B96_16555 [Horticoccus luteus]